MMHKTAAIPFLFAAGTMVLVSSPAYAADFELALKATGKRDYYCTATLEVTNTTSDVVLDEINGRVMLRSKDAPVGRSKGASLLAIPPGAAATATYETPDAPCEAIDGYTFVISICRIGGRFVDAADCAARISVAAPIDGVTSQ